MKHLSRAENDANTYPLTSNDFRMKAWTHSGVIELDVSVNEARS